MRCKSLFYKPLSWLVASVVKLRHVLYDKGFFRSYSFSQPIIKIGNLSFGGTGKSPMAIHIANMYKDHYATYILSRGYGRKTRNILEIDENTSWQNAGDEALMMKMKLKEVGVVVSADRVGGIHFINRFENEKKKLIILDDALQHRKLVSGFQILLTSYSNPFFSDNIYPSGYLRDLKERVVFANLVVVTKTSRNSDTELIYQKIRDYTDAKIIFSGLKYGQIHNIWTKSIARLDSQVIVVSGIANDEQFVSEVQNQTKIAALYSYLDHHKFTENDIRKWCNEAANYNITQILTTEKDAIRIRPFRQYFDDKKLEVIALPVEIELSKEAEQILRMELDKYIAQYYSTKF